MTDQELRSLLQNGENSGVEFKRDDVHPDSLAKEIAALLNLEGGCILLGIEDDGAVSGLARDSKSAEEWVMTVCRDHVKPSMIPYWETMKLPGGLAIGLISLPADSPDKPYKARRGSAWLTFIRTGSLSREATREEEARLYQAPHLMRYDIKSVVGSSLDDLDLRRLTNYFRDILKQDCPAMEDASEWTRVLVNTDLMVMDRGRALATAGGLLLFGQRPNHFLPQAGVTTAAFPGQVKDYVTNEEQIIRGPLVSLFTPKGDIVDMGVIDAVIAFTNRNMGALAWLEYGQRRQKQSYPAEAVREAIVNAVAHRDYTITVTDVELSLYQDRLEVISPGNLPNTVTVEKMKQGYRAARNELLKDILRDYGYVEHRGMGVRNRIIRGMREHNGTEPDLIEQDARFIVRLFKGPISL